MSPLGSGSFTVRAGLALLVAHGRYWTRVAPVVRRLLAQWELRAAAIPEARLRSLALLKLSDERFNVEVAAMIATNAPRRHRIEAIKAIVAQQVMYDYLDAITEQPAADPIADRLEQTRALVQAVSPAEPLTREYFAAGSVDDDGYLGDLAAAVRASLRRLPSAEVISAVAPACATRCAEAQARVHAIGDTGRDPLKRWAEQQAEGTQLEWREWLFGAMGSVVGAHALIALAADESTTAAWARQLDSTYLVLCVLTTALDHLVDQERDAVRGDPSYLSLYETREELSDQVALVTRRALESVRTLPSGAHHAMILAGVVAYYTSQPGAMGTFARPVTEHVRDQLGPVMTPTLASLHLWRAAKALKRRLAVLQALRLRRASAEALPPRSSARSSRRRLAG